MADPTPTGLIEGTIRPRRARQWAIPRDGNLSIAHADVFEFDERGYVVVTEEVIASLMEAAGYEEMPPLLTSQDAAP